MRWFDIDDIVDERFRVQADGFTIVRSDQDPWHQGKDWFCIDQMPCSMGIEKRLIHVAFVFQSPIVTFIACAAYCVFKLSLSWEPNSVVSTSFRTSLQDANYTAKPRPAPFSTLSLHVLSEFEIHQ